MSSESHTSASTFPPPYTDGLSADGEHFLADASARLAESLDVYATIRTLSELAVESFADGCAITLVRHGPGERPSFTEHDLHIAEELGRRAGVAIDNARLYAAEQAARSSAQESEARLTDVLDSMMEAFYGYDRNWRIVRLNRD